jgi:hypothetical protein
MSAPSLYLNSAAKTEYVKKLKAFASLREALDLSDKVVLGASARLLDPYHETSKESRQRLLERYPVHSFGLLKRIPLFALTNIGYSEDSDREKMTHLRYVQYKPLEPHLDENNQEFSIKADSQQHTLLVSSEQSDGYVPLYAEGKVSAPYADLFKESQAVFDSEMETYVVANNYLENTPHLMKEITKMGYVIYCPTVYLQAALHSEFLSLAEVHGFVDNQVALINDEIAKSLVRKNKNERERTELFRSFINAYKIFKNEYLPQASE